MSGVNIPTRKAQIGQEADSLIDPNNYVLGALTEETAPGNR